MSNPTTQTETRPVPPLAISRLEIKNFRGLELFVVKPNGEHFRVDGPNSAGKSSVLDSLPWIVGNKTSKEIGDPVHHGAEEAEGFLELGPRGGPAELILRRTVTAEGKTRLFAKQADGKTIKADVVETLIGRYMLNPVDLVDKLRPQDQTAAFLEVCNIKPPVAQVTAIVGEEIPAAPNESADQYFLRLAADGKTKQRGGIYYNARLEAGQVVEQKEKAKREVDERLAALGGPLSKAEQDVSLSQQSEAMDKLHARQQKRTAALATVNDSENEVRISRGELQSLEEQHATAEREISELEQRLAERRHGLAEIDRRMAERQQELKELNEQLSADRIAANELVDPAPEIAQVKAAIRQIEATNEALGRRRALWQESCRVGQELEQAAARRQSLHDTLTAIRELWAGIMEGVKTQFPDVGVVEGELCYRGTPLRGCARNEQIWTGALIATGQNPRPPLPILRIDEGERIGPDLEHRLQKLCWDRGYQFVYSRRVDVKYVPADGGLFREIPLDGLETEIVIKPN